MAVDNSGLRVALYCSSFFKFNKLEYTVGRTVQTDLLVKDKTVLVNTLHLYDIPSEPDLRTFYSGTTYDVGTICTDEVIEMMFDPEHCNEKYTRL